MRTDGVFTVARHIVDVPAGQSLRLIPFGDIHFDSPAFCWKSWGKFIKRTKAIKGPVVYLGMGDYLDGYSTSERSIMGSEHLHESSRIRHDREGWSRVHDLYKQLKHIPGSKIIGLMGGNHFQQYSDGTTSDKLLAEKLGCEYLGSCALIRLVLRQRGRALTVDIFAHHGKGYGTTAGGKLNSVEKMHQMVVADICLMGDNHARGVIPAGRLLKLRHDANSVAGVSLDDRGRWVGRTGSFLKSYEPGTPSYVVDKCLPPADLGWIEFILTPKRARKGRGGCDEDVSWVDINAWQ